MRRPHIDTTNSSLWGILLVAVTIAAGIVSAPSTALSEADERPLVMTFIDVSSEADGQVGEKLRSIISNSEQVEFRSAETALPEIEKFDVDREVLASTRKRGSHRELIRRAMRAQELESIVVYERVRDTLHLIVIGPTGGELRHFRERAPSSRLSDDRAVEYLEEIFEVLVPEVRTFRKQRSEISKERGLTEEDSLGATDDPKEKAVVEHRRKHGNLRQNLTLSASPIFGRRQLSMVTGSGYRLDHSTPFFGAEGRVEGILGLIAADTAALGGTAFGQFAPFSTRFDESDGASPGTLFRTGLSARYLAGLGPALVLYGEAGGELLDIGLESNSVYVGSRYVAGSGGVGLMYRFEGIGTVDVAGHALPTFLTETHEGAFGDADFSFGAKAHGAFTFSGLDPLVFSASYSFVLYRPTHRNPPAYAGEALGNDFLHIGGLSAGYRF